MGVSVDVEEDTVRTMVVWVVDCRVIELMEEQVDCGKFKLDVGSCFRL